MVSVSRKETMRRAWQAEIGSAKKNQAWAPLPERERSMATGNPTFLHVSENASTSSFHTASSKSAATNQQVSSGSSGYTPMVCLPIRWPRTT
jgi:hypothetical protein